MDSADIRTPEPAVHRLADASPYARVNILRVGSLLLRRRRLVILLPAALFLLTAVIGLLAKRTYTSWVAFTPQSTAGALPNLSGFAAQFGVDVGSGDPEQSPEFYADLIRSPQLLRAVVESEFRVNMGEDVLDGTLIELFEIDAGTPARGRELAVKRLRDAVVVETNLRTGVVRFGVSARPDTLAWLLASRILDAVNAFNLESRQTQASHEREFIEGRVGTAREELRASEDALQAFLQENRQYGSSPQLVFEHDRLQREVVMHQQVYTTLVQSYEQARIDEVRNTPVITVVEHPVVAARPDGRLLLFRGLVAIVIGLLLGGLAAVGMEAFELSRDREPEATNELVTLSHETLSDIRRPWRLFRTPSSRRG